MGIGQIVMAAVLVGVIVLAVYRGVVQPYMEKKHKQPATVPGAKK